MQRCEFENAFTAPERSPEIPEAHDIYGWLLGSWDLAVEYYAAVDLSSQSITGEVHFARVLEGRGIQDTWIMPRRTDRDARLGNVNNMYGTTLRIWDASLEAWRITWINPVSGHRAEQIGRRIGADIVQIGTRANGTPIRWRFRETTPDSFLWTGDALDADGTTWKLEGQFRARRMTK